MGELSTSFYGVLAAVVTGALLLGYLLASVRLKRQLSAVIAELDDRQQQLTTSQQQLAQWGLEFEMGG